MTPSTRPLGRLAAIDFGTRRLGIAIIDPVQKLASPYANYTRRDPQQDAQFLQQLVHEDMLADFAAYPRLWGASRPDPNIDHRRVKGWLAAHQRADRRFLPGG